MSPIKPHLSSFLVLARQPGTAICRDLIVGICRSLSVVIPHSVNTFSLSDVSVFLPPFTPVRSETVVHRSWSVRSVGGGSIDGRENLLINGLCKEQPVRPGPSMPPAERLPLTLFKVKE